MHSSRYMKRFGTSYYRASLFFPHDVKKDVFDLYALVRIADNIVDNNMRSKSDAEEQLNMLKSRFMQAYNNADCIAEDPTISAALMYRRRKLPLERIHSFFDAMIQDTWCDRYQSYEKLQQYMYGSAEVIGLMLTHIIGWQKDADKYARILWEAMQYTNFLRDVCEDYVKYWRIYMPWSRLLEYNLHEGDIVDYCHWKPVDERWERYMKRQCETTKSLYRKANKGIALLHPKGRLAVYLASKLYESILNKIARNRYDVFSKNTKLWQWEKLQKLFITLLQYAVSRSTY